MSGNTPNVSRNNFSYAHTLIGAKSALYDSVPLQQGVPVIDSDVNEMQDYRRMMSILQNLALYGYGASISPFGAYGGFQVYQAPSNNNNFGLRAGFASVAGILIPSTAAIPPAYFYYNDQIFFSGALTAGTSGAVLEDTTKNFAAAHSLPASTSSPKHAACVVKMTSGAQSGNYAYILAASGTSFTIDETNAVIISGSTKTKIVASGLVAGDTYQIIPPPLQTPGGARTDKVYLHVWYEDICDAEDASIVNTDVGVEAVHKTAVFWAVRVSENGTSPVNSNANIYGFGHRYLELATLTRTTSSAVTTAMIANSLTAVTNLGTFNSESVHFDWTTYNLYGWDHAGASDTVQAGIDQILINLESHTTGGSNLIGQAAISGVPSSISAGSVDQAVTELLSLVNGRIRTYEPTIAATLTSGGPVLIWRSHGATTDGSVTKDTVSIYVAQSATRGGCILTIVGGYLSGANAYPGTGSPSYVSMKQIFGKGESTYVKDTPVTNWLWDTASAWSRYDEFNGTMRTFTSTEVTLTDSHLFLGAGGFLVASSFSTTPKDVISTSLTPGTSSRPVIYTATDGIWITQNCYYDSSRWWSHDIARYSVATHFTENGVIVYKKYISDNPAAGWIRTGVGTGKWTVSTHILKIVTYGMISIDVAAETAGPVLEIVPFSAYGSVPVGDTSCTLWCPIKFATKRETAPVTLTNLAFTDASANVNQPSCTYVPDASVPEWGGHVQIVTTGTLAAGDLVYARGYLTIYD